MDDDRYGSAGGTRPNEASRDERPPPLQERLAARPDLEHDAGARTPAAGRRSDDLALYVELNRTFRFYIALTVAANLGYAAVFGLVAAGAGLVGHPLAVAALLVPGMISTGFAVLAVYGLAEARGLDRAVRAEGERLGLAHVTRADMLLAQTALTLVFHTLIALVSFAYPFFVLVGALPF